MKHFEFFPKVDYSNNLAVNIMVRGKIRDAILEKHALYYRYVITDEDRPDLLSKKYYGSHQYTWAIFYANNIFHPVLDWPKTSREMYEYLKLKYGDLNLIQSIKSTPHHYEFTDPYTKKVYVIDEASYHNEYSKEYPDHARGITIYDHEISENEKKRNIVMLDKQYLYQITNELGNLFK